MATRPPYSINLINEQMTAGGVVTFDAAAGYRYVIKEVDVALQGAADNLGELIFAVDDVVFCRWGIPENFHNDEQWTGRVTFDYGHTFAVTFNGTGQTASVSVNGFQFLLP